VLRDRAGTSRRTGTLENCHKSDGRPTTTFGGRRKFEFSGANSSFWVWRPFEKLNLLLPKSVISPRASPCIHTETHGYFVEPSLALNFTDSGTCKCVWTPEGQATGVTTPSTQRQRFTDNGKVGYLVVSAHCVPALNSQVLRHLSPLLLLGRDPRDCHTIGSC
jgi:hypothetical protein